MGKELHIETKCLHSGWKPKKGEPRMMPIYQSTTFKYDTSEEMGRLFDLKDEGYFYTRLQNPTNDMVAEKITDLEGGVAGVLTSSGQAANFYAVFNICEAGDHVICASAIYGGTLNLLGVTAKKMGIECTFIDADAPAEELEKAFQPNTKAVFSETISNPALVVLDIEKMAKQTEEEVTLAYYLPKVVEEAVKLHMPGIFIGDVIQEGNVSLMLYLGENKKATEAEVLEQVRAGIRVMLESHTEEKRRDKKMVERVNDLDETIKSMKEEYGRKVSVDEVAERMGITEDTVEDILKLAGEEVKDE